MNSEEVVAQFRALANPAAVEGMARYGINPAGTLGVSMPSLRALARSTGKDHQLAQDLWETGLHEARILAGLVDDPHEVDEEQLERWVKDFDSWDVCDQVCSNLFDRTPFAYQKAVEWSGRGEEFVKRAGFVLMAGLAVHDKTAGDEQFEGFLPLILREAVDERNFVKKAVNWALRGIGKRNRNLNTRALETAHQIAQLDSRAARWIAADAERELSSAKIQEKVNREGAQRS